MNADTIKAASEALKPLLDKLAQVALCIYGAMLTDIIGRFVNPEWYALQSLLALVK